MPVTARLSRKFYETFGEDVTNELVDWFNSVDATYRGDLRELNELNFSRFDAKLEQRLAELDARWSSRLVDADAKWNERWMQLDAKLDQRIGELRRELGAIKADLIKWMFAFWAPTALAVGAILFRK